MNLLDILFPRRCVSCGKIGNYFCKNCVSKIEFTQYQICPVCGRSALDGKTHPGCFQKYGLDGMYAAVHFRGPIRKAFYQLKYGLVADLVPFLVDFIDFDFFHLLPHFEYLIPVPLHPKRQRDRGFNQSELLAKEIGERVHVSVLPTLERVKNTSPQAELSIEERKKNTRNAFIVRRKEGLRGKLIALVDDVGTTRSTLTECAKLLKVAGAKSVWAIVIAHG